MQNESGILIAKKRGNDPLKIEIRIPKVHMYVYFIILPNLYSSYVSSKLPVDVVNTLLGFVVY